MLILAIDTSGHTASAALLEDSTLRAQVSLYTLRTHSQVMLPLCRQLLDNAGVTLEEIDLFAVADGPGSYTGLRIGISAVKGMAFALGKPCAGISTLEGMAYNLLGTRGTLCCAIHARQQLHYCAIFSSDGREITRLTEDAILPQEHLLEQLRTLPQPVTVCGDGAAMLLEAEPGLIQAPPHLLLQSAAGIALAARHAQPVDADALCARYLQATQAEKLKHE